MQGFKYALYQYHFSFFQNEVSHLTDVLAHGL